MGIEAVHQIFADFVVGVVLLGVRVTDGGLDLKVGQEGRTGDNDETLAAAQVLGSQRHEAVGRPRRTHTWESRPGRPSCPCRHRRSSWWRSPYTTRGHGIGDDGGGLSVRIHHMDGGAAVLAKQLGVQVVVGVVRIELHPVQQEGVKVVAAQVEALGLAAVVGFVLELIVADTQMGAQGFQN